MEEKKEQQIELQSDNQSEQNTTPQQQTIMPTMLDSSENKEEKSMNLSSIVPKGPSVTVSEGTEIRSKEHLLKSDGAVVIGTIKSEDEYEVVANVELPEPIDLKKRKQDKQNHSNRKKGLDKKQAKKQEIKDKSQRFTIMLSLISIGIIVAFAFYMKYKPTEDDFEPLHVTIELGDALPTKLKYFVKPPIGFTINEMAYSLDTSSVIIDEVGEYEFKVVHNGKEKIGTVEVKDTTSPKVVVREVVITEGSTYNPESFVADCKDFNGCNYSFENDKDEANIEEPGQYVVHIVATDAYGNSAMAKASLVIEAKGLVKKFVKEFEYNFENGYSYTEIYDLHFSDVLQTSILLNGTHILKYKYTDDKKFEETIKQHTGESEYTFDRGLKLVTYTEKISSVGNNYSEMSFVDNYLYENGYTISND